jgi:uncharacterized membrane protein YcaP (DUF421 family)
MEIVFRSTAVFFFLWFLTRAMGRRQLSEMTAFELVLIVTFGDLVQQAVTQEDMSVTGGVLAVGTMGLWITLFSAIGFRWRGTRAAIDGVPVVVVRDGEPVPEALRLERLPVEELLESARKSGIDDLAKVRLGVLEPDGKFSFIPYDAGGGGDDQVADKQGHAG